MNLRRLVKLAARAFYDDLTSKGDNQQKTGRSDNRGIAVVVLDALTRRQWVREEDLAKDLKLHTKQLRRTLRFFEEEKIITRDHRRESGLGLLQSLNSNAFCAQNSGCSSTSVGRDSGKLNISLHLFRIQDTPIGRKRASVQVLFCFRVVYVPGVGRGSGNLRSLSTFSEFKIPL
ncbi:hypothetical protein V8G54_016227 [Vigna mungo]|uniref:HTH TFE/IIEalpha-type domain-containing protein n=1 Tax=Vigna mungo TaxID=3915 RepID=A0AAQ3NLZ7_VIGMU